MKVDANKSSSVETVITVRISWDQVASDYRKILNNLRKNLKLDGFRPGKVPEGIAKRVLGPQLKYDFTNDVIRGSFENAVKEAGIEDYVDLNVTDVDFEEGGDFTYQMTVETDPQITLPDYQKGFPIQHEKYVVDKSDIDLYLEDMREQHALIQEVTEGAQEGHYIIGDIQECDDSGVPLIGKKIENRMIKVGEGVFGEPGARGLIGAKPEDTVRISVKPPKGEKVNYEISIKRVESHTLPELTDDFIADNIKGVETYKGLRDQVEKSLQAEWDSRSEADLQRAIQDYFVDNTDFEIPPSRINTYIEGVINEIRQRNQEEEIDEQQVREKYTSIAKREIRWYLIQREITAAQQLDVSNEEINARVETESQRYDEKQRPQLVRFYRKKENRNRLENEILQGKIFAHLKEQAKIKTKSVKTSELRKREQNQ